MDPGATYAFVAAITAVITWGLVYVIRHAWLAVLGSAVLVTGGYLAWARISVGYWDKFTIVALIVLLTYTSVVATVSVFVGRKVGIVPAAKENAS